MQGGFLPLRNVDCRTQKQTGTQRENKIADPGGRQIREQFLVVAEVARRCRIGDTAEDVAMTQRDSFRRAGRSGGMEQNRNVIGARPTDQLLGEAGLGGKPPPTGRNR